MAKRKNKIMKHPGINQRTGRLKKGWKYKKGSKTPVRA